MFKPQRPGVVFHPGGGIDGGAVLEVQATLRRLILRAFVGRGLLENFEAKEMLAYKHSGFSVDAGVRIGMTVMRWQLRDRKSGRIGIW